VIRGDEPAGAAPDHPASADAAPSGTTAPPAGPAGQVRAITAGEAIAQRQPDVLGPPTVSPIPAASRNSVPDVPPEHIYGPDDPAYGPPGPGWYKRGEERPPATADPAPQADEGEQLTARGPFEPLRGADAGYVPASYPQDGGQPGDRPETPAHETAEIPEAHEEPQAHETLEDLGLDTPTDPEAGALGQVRDLYQVAGKISLDSLERHFDQLLDRQRKLISDYFSESSPPSVAATLLTPPPSFGFDLAESLAGLRGGLRDSGLRDTGPRDGE
jgi:hypothetical protein